MKLALLESHIIWENKTENYNRLEAILKELSSCHIDLICLPEMSFTGFSMNVECTRDHSRETMKKMAELSCTYGLMIAFGWVGKDEEGFKNHYSIINKDNLQLDYEKIHPFSYGGEADFFAGGSLLRRAFIKDFKMGIQICYDLRFPETFQILSKDADLIIVPANWPEKREKHWDILLRARAIENQVYIAGINCRGKMDDIHYSGHSCLIAPDGELCRGNRIDFENENSVYIYEITNNVEDYRRAFPVKRDRREKLYYNLLHV